MAKYRIYSSDLAISVNSAISLASWRRLEGDGARLDERKASRIFSPFWSDFAKGRLGCILLTNKGDGMLLTTFMAIAGWQRNRRLGLIMFLLAIGIQLALLIAQIFFLRDAVKAPPLDASVIIPFIQSAVIGVLIPSAVMGLIFYFIGVSARMIRDRYRRGRPA